MNIFASDVQGLFFSYALEAERKGDPWRSHYWLWRAVRIEHPDEPMPTTFLLNKMTGG